MKLTTKIYLGSQFLFLSSQVVGAATLPSPLLLSLIDDDHFNSTFLPNISHRANHTLSLPTMANLPSDPYEYLVPFPGDPGITVKFYDYGPRRLLSSRVLEALCEAVRDRNEHMDDPDGSMGIDERLYEDGDVVLLLHPTPELYWSDWGVAIKGLLHFTGTYNNVEMYYDIFEEGVGLIGTGALSEW